MAFATDERLALANQGIFIRVLLLQTCARLQQSYSSPKFQRGSDVLNGLYAVVGQFPSTIGQLLYFVVLCAFVPLCPSVPPGSFVPFWRNNLHMSENILPLRLFKNLNQKQ